LSDQSPTGEANISLIVLSGKNLEGNSRETLIIAWEAGLLGS